MRFWNSPSRVDRKGRAIVLMPGPYDNCSKKVNGINTYDVFGSHRRCDRVSGGAAVLMMQVANVQQGDDRSLLQ